MNHQIDLYKLNEIIKGHNYIEYANKLEDKDLKKKIEDMLNSKMVHDDELNEFFKIIFSGISNEEKLQYFKKAIRVLKIEILKVIDDDEIKIDFINENKNSLSANKIANILSSVKNEKLKIQYFKTNYENYNYLNYDICEVNEISTILKIINDDDYKAYVLDNIYMNYPQNASSFFRISILKIISSFQNDDQKLKYLKNQNIDIIDVNLVFKTMSAESKIKFIEDHIYIKKNGSGDIECINTDRNLISLIKNLDIENRENVIKRYIKNCQNIKITYKEHLFANYLLSTLPDDLKISYLEKDFFREDSTAFKDGIEKIEDDELRLNFIKNNLKNIHRIDLIILINHYEDDDIRSDIYMNYPDGNKKLNDYITSFLMNFKDSKKALSIVDNFVESNKKYIEYSAFSRKKQDLSDDFSFMDQYKSSKCLEIFSQMCRAFEDNDSIFYLLDNYSYIMNKNLLIHLLTKQEVDDIKKCTDFIKKYGDEELCFLYLQKKEILEKDLPDFLKSGLENPIYNLLLSQKYPYFLDKYQEDGEEIGISKKITIGLELEAVGPDASKLPGKKLIGGYDCVIDGSLPQGCEVRTKISRDTKEDMKLLESICNCMKDAKFYCDEKCGGHIHLGADYLQGDFAAFQNLFTIWNECEELIYKVSNPVGQMPRHDTPKWAVVSHMDIEETFPNGNVQILDQNDLDELLDIFMLREPKYRGINLSHMGSYDKNTIEFRIPNGTLNIKDIKDNIRLYGSIFEVSKKNAQDKEYKKDEFKKIRNRFVTEEQKLEAFLSLVFSDPEIQDIYRKRWEYSHDDKTFEILTKYSTQTFIKHNSSYYSLGIADFDAYVKYLDKNKRQFYAYPIIDDIDDNFFANFEEPESIDDQDYDDMENDIY